MVRHLAGLLVAHEQDIMDANRLDMQNAQTSGLLFQFRVSLKEVPLSL